jgi:hypothetical protein
MFALNQVVNWKDCPGSIWMFELTRIRGISPCGEYALLGFIRHPVKMDSLTAAEDSKNFWAKYLPTANQWGEDGKDKSTGEDLTRWIHARN